MIITLGDSVTWGQGLLDEHKFDRIFGGDSLLPRGAHSGAIIGASSDSSSQKEYPEIPVPFPSIWQQVAAVKDWTEIDLVIVNGGINDVSLTRILNPWITEDQVVQLTKQFCQLEMAKLLVSLAERLKKPSTKIAVIGYYPILSNLSNFDNEKQPRMLMEMHGVTTGSAVAGTTFEISSLVSGIIANCLAFWKTSSVSLEAATDSANATTGRTVCAYVDPGFTEDNALWGPDTLLWELSPLLEPEDEVTQLRNMACGDIYGDLVHLPEWGQWYQCCRASVGHPNVAGAAQIAAKITNVLS